jgi:hypothetical protein
MDAERLGESSYDTVVVGAPVGRWFRQPSVWLDGPDGSGSVSAIDTSIDKFGGRPNLKQRCHQNKERYVNKNAVKELMVASVIVGLNGACRAQDIDLGKSDFQSSCAACHGTDGKGKGPVSAQLKVAPADLTVLAKNNKGVFPFSAVYEAIDGRQVIIAHGSRDMPIWGMRYNLGRYSPLDPEAIVRTRILAIVDYLNRIQEK